MFKVYNLLTMKPQMKTTTYIVKAVFVRGKVCAVNFFYQKDLASTICMLQLENCLEMIYRNL